MLAVDLHCVVASVYSCVSEFDIRTQLKPWTCTLDGTAYYEDFRPSAFDGTSPGKRFVALIYGKKQRDDIKLMQGFTLFSRTILSVINALHALHCPPLSR